ncbi:uncharacterized protein RHIMIDRAFT_280338 [Rhizopus microsporus ATCC 52813]|uniref:Uncharacterized protein n=1 Tax=Rhizopus microsporus ATCC 52813 TaxID=1340429 RepID=A0A2G4SYA4_RHIZD|nr:uncharacterized protein RHIMIDRAFT_280338 [Rhizopus microsporus ATCC 52813]PHZ13742.1 hypothetical protein RHIMIDRAFT_280338 [Rhizopus microsporus ATCC 52813]
MFLEKSIRFSKKVDDFGFFDVCYETDPKKPVLFLLARVHFEPFIFKVYKSSSNQALRGECNAIGSNFVKQLLYMFRILVKID